MTTKTVSREQLKKFFPMLEVKFSAKGVRHEKNADGVLVEIHADQEKEESK